MDYIRDIIYGIIGVVVAVLSFFGVRTINGNDEAHKHFDERFDDMENRMNQCQKENDGKYATVKEIERVFASNDEIFKILNQIKDNQSKQGNALAELTGFVKAKVN